MRKFFYVLIIQFLFLQTAVYGQIFFSVELQEDKKTYLVKLRSENTYAAPLNTTNNGYITFVVPTGGFKVGNIQNIKGNWENRNNIIAPSEFPNNDYLSFGLNGSISDINYKADEEFELFSFENIGECTGKLDFISEEEVAVFVTKQLGSGNQITILGAGQVNAFSGTYGTAADCKQSTGNQGCVLIDSVRTTNPALCGTIGGTITIHARVDNGLNLQYSIDDGVSYQADSIFTGLVSGKRYSIIVRDEVPLCITNYGIVELGPPADAVIINTSSTPDECMKENGTIKIDAVPIIAETTLEFSLDQGQTWLANNGLFTGLDDGTYHPRVRAKDAPCFDETDEIVVEAGCPTTGGGNENCTYTYVLEGNNGVFTVSILSDTTITAPKNITSTAQVILKVPTGTFQVSNFKSLIDGVQFGTPERSTAPVEAPTFDYISFGMTTLGASNITYTKGVKVPFFSFENSGHCTGNQVFLMENFTDPFFADANNENSLGVNANQNLTVFETGTDLSIICVNSNSISDCGEPINTGGNDFSKDTVFLTVPIEDTTNVCIGDELEISNIGDVSLCSNGGTVMLNLTNNTNCFDIITDDHFNQTETFCLIHMDASDPSLSDTTIFILCPQVKLGDDLSICAGETTQLKISGGTGNFTWITDGNISCTDCPNPDITPDISTQYILTSVDGNHCKDSDTIMVNVLDAAADLQVNSTDLSNCEHNGTISITVNKGVGPFKYSIDNGTTYQDASLFENLAAGTYQVVVANQEESCTTTWPQEVELKANGAPSLVKLEAQAPNTCINEKGAITVIGTINSNETLEYSIDNGVNWQTDTLFSDLDTGSYRVLIRIENTNCVTPFINNPVQLVEQTGVQIITSPGDRTICSSDSSLMKLEINENIQSFTILGGNFENATSENNILSFKALPTSEGTVYTITIVGESGCTVTEEFTLTMSNENTSDWNPTLDITPATCANNDGSIKVTVSGGNNGFTFCWEPNKASGPLREGLSSDSIYSLTITGSSGCTLVYDELSVGTSCTTMPCNFFTGLDTLNAFIADGKATACIPIANMDLSEFQFYLGNQLTQMEFGECMQTSVFYDYGTLLDQGGAPYQLINWSVDKDTLKNFQFNTFEELVTKMNQFDFQTNWILNKDLQVIQGFSSNKDAYGSLGVQPDNSSQITELQLNTTTTMYQSIILDDARGVKKYTIKDSLNNCEDDLFIKVQGLHDGMDTMDLVTLVNTPITNQCLNTDETGTENLEIKICNAPATGVMTPNGSSDNCFGYTPNADFVGKDFFCLELCNGSICDTTLVRVTVKDAGLVFFTGFSPNNDEINDVFTIKNIENYPENNLIIYNRWGNRIYKKEGYTNAEGWDGTFDMKKLPDGVYFYLLKVNIDNKQEIFSGPVTIAR
jgi:gliding motility-associated-like protein